MDTKPAGEINNLQPNRHQLDRSGKASGYQHASENRHTAKSGQGDGETLSISEQSRLAQNKMILQSALNVNLSAGDHSMELLYRTAIDNINAELEPVMGKDALQSSYDSALDVSPKATADRIVSLSTAFFGSYQKQHPEMSVDEALDSFVSVISGGIDRGFGEARDILNGLDVLEGDITDNIDKTYELVQEGLKAFIDKFSS